jgi:hypothetical protein
VHRYPGEPGQDTGVVHGVGSAFGVRGEQRGAVGGSGMQPGQCSIDPEPGFVEMHQPGTGKTPPDIIGEPGQLLSRTLGDRGNRALRYGHVEQFAQCLRGAVLRQELPDVEVQDQRFEPWPVLHRSGHIVRGLRSCHAPATRALLRHKLVLGEVRRDRWDVEHRPAFYTGLRCPAKPPAAAATASRFVPHHRVRVTDLP